MTDTQKTTVTVESPIITRAQLIDTSRIEASIADLVSLAPYLKTAIENGKDYWKDVTILGPALAALNKLIDDATLAGQELGPVLTDHQVTIDTLQKVLDGLCQVARGFLPPPAPAAV